MQKFYTVIEETSSGKNELKHFTSFKKAFSYVEFLCGEIVSIILPRKNLEKANREWISKKYHPDRWKRELKNRNNLKDKTYVGKINKAGLNGYSIKVQLLL